MNAFQILNKEGQPISMNILDQEAAEFWQVKHDAKYYASPTEKSSSNWYDIIGWNIARQGNWTSGWANVVTTLMAESLGRCLFQADKNSPIKLAEFVGTDFIIHLEDKVEEEIAANLNFYRPYINLINHWIEKGYTPKQIVE